MTQSNASTHRIRAIRDLESLIRERIGARSLDDVKAMVRRFMAGVAGGGKRVESLLELHPVLGGDGTVDLCQGSRRHSG